MTELLRIHVSGTPRPQPRPRFVRGRVVSTGSRLTKLWRVIMMASFVRERPQEPIDQAVRIDVLFMMPTKDKRRWGKPHTCRPDKDNLEKPVLDCLVKAKVLKDDSLAYTGEPLKVWAERGGIDVRIGDAGSQRLAV
jgi:Holliday junction resolvase RusA-like endonuclease